MEADGRLMTEVADRWGAQALFATQSPEVAAAARADRLVNEPAHLAAALRGIGTGVMAPLWERLGELRMPVVVLTGEHDAKYVALGRRLAGALPAARLQIVPGAGHALPLEAPAAVAAALASLAR
jgi:pimeloyl-ACP methyl ester carboxylesterase